MMSFQFWFELYFVKLNLIGYWCILTWIILFYEHLFIDNLKGTFIILCFKGFDSFKFKDSLTIISWMTNLLDISSSEMIDWTLKNSNFMLLEWCFSNINTSISIWFTKFAWNQLFRNASPCSLRIQLLCS